MAWSSQPQLNPAIEHVSMVVQGIKKADKLSRMLLCEHASRTNSFQVLETYWCVQQERELQTESGVMTWITPIKSPHLDGSLGSFTMPATFTMPAGCLNASEKLTRWVAKYGTIADSMFSSECSGWGLTFAPQWQSLLGNCRASHSLGNSADTRRENNVIMTSKWGRGVVLTS